MPYKDPVRAKECTKRAHALKEKEGYCHQCHARLCIKGKSRCLECTRIRRHVSETRRDSGLCWRCGGPLEDRSFKRCKPCRKNNVRYKMAWVKKNYDYFKGYQRDLWWGRRLTGSHID